MKDDYTTNSQYLAYTFVLKSLGEFTYLNLGVKGLMTSQEYKYQNVQRKARTTGD